jgi:hypothetical protein
MKKNKFIILVMIPIFFSCKKIDNEVFIGDSPEVKISGVNGEVTIKFKENSMIINQIETIDKVSNIQIIQSISDIGLIESKMIRNHQISHPQKYLSFILDQENESINDSMDIEISQQLLTNHIVKINGGLYYLATFENGKKVYNSLNLKTIEAKIVNQDKLNLLLKNDFPFKGSFNFYNYNSKTKLEAKEIENNLFSVVYNGIKPEDSVVLIDVEILPFETDTLLNSTFTQRINIKQ